MPCATVMAVLRDVIEAMQQDTGQRLTELRVDGGAAVMDVLCQLQADLLTLWELGRKTIIFVTHDITEAIALGDRALVLSKQPTRIAAEHAIPIPRPRNVKDIFALEGFAAVYERIRADVQ